MTRILRGVQDCHPPLGSFARSGGGSWVGYAWRVVLALVSSLAGASTAHAQAGHEPAVPCHAADLGSTKPVMERNFPDAFVLCADGKFYAYATNSPGYNVPFARSQDLKNWVFEGEAMPDAPVWAVSDEDKRDLWAPEVIKLGQKYVLYFSARHQVVRTPNGDPRECIGVATSGAPDGPFEAERVPLICSEFEEGVIDASPYVEDGKVYLYFKADGNCCLLPASIQVVELTGDGGRLKGRSQPLGVVNDREWEGAVVEAPTMVRHDDKHYLFYSANAYYKPEYGVAYAECEGLAGPCKKPAGNHVLGECAFSLSPPLKGPGHQSIIEADRRTFITYHTLVPSPDEAGFTGDRQLHVNELTWADTGPTVRLLGEQPSSLGARCGKQVQHRPLP